MSELSFGLNFYCHFLFSSKILHCELWNVGNHCFSFLIDMWLEPLLIDTPILRTLRSQKQYIQRFTYWIWVLWFRHPTGGILYPAKLYTETGYAPRFNCYHLDKKGTPFVYLLQQKYTSKLYGGSQPYQQIYFKVLPKVVFTSKSLLLRVFFSRSYCCYGYEHDTIEWLWWPIKI